MSSTFLIETHNSAAAASLRQRLRNQGIELLTRAGEREIEVVHRPGQPELVGKLLARIDQWLAETKNGGVTIHYGERFYQITRPAT